jgi:hypothetical protein
MAGLKETLMKHKFAVGGVALVGLFVLYELLSSSGGSSASSPASAALGYSLQEQQLQAQSDAQANQVSAQLQAANLSAQAANNQTIGAVDENNANVDASLIAALAQNQTSAQANTLAAQTQQQQNSLEAETNNNYINSQLQATENTNATNLSAYENANGLQQFLGNLQYQLNSQYLTGQNNLASEQLQNQYNLEQSAQQAVNAAGLNHGTNSLEEQLTAIESEILGESNVGVAAEQANEAGTVSSNQASASILGSIFGKNSALSSLLSGLLA